MTDRELMQQALEALQHCLHYAQTHLQDFDAAYNRHPSTENERGVITDDIEDTFAAIAALRDRLEQPEQEPVAWKDRTYGNLHHQNYGNSIPLYTAPQPAQQPLTHPKIHELDWPDDVSFEDILLFTRAIEQAHGIGEKK